MSRNIKSSVRSKSHKSFAPAKDVNSELKSFGKQQDNNSHHISASVARELTGPLEATIAQLHESLSNKDKTNSQLQNQIDRLSEQQEQLGTKYDSLYSEYRQLRDIIYANSNPWDFELHSVPVDDARWNAAKLRHKLCCSQLII